MDTDYEEEKRKLSDERMADAEGAFERLFQNGHTRSEYASGVNHPNRKGHEVIAECLAECFPYCP